MRKRALGSTGLMVSELALGTWGLSGDGYGSVPERDQDAVIERARALGITLFETADCYGNGSMEQRLGRHLANDPECVLVTKIGTDREGAPPRKRFEVGYLRESLARCQERLRRSPLDVVLLHNPSAAAVIRGEAGAFLAGEVARGALKAWGVSAATSEIALAALSRSCAPQVVEVAYNVLFSRDARLLAGRLSDTGIGLLARSVLAHGLLAGFWQQDKVFPAEDHRAARWTADQLRRRLYQLRALQLLHGRDVPSSRAAAIDYVLDDARVSAAVLGPRDTVQLDQLVREVAKGPPYLPNGSRARLEARLVELGVQL